MEKRLVLPIYILVDIGRATAPADSSALRHAVAKLVSPVFADVASEMPLVRGKVRFSLLTFSDRFDNVVPLCDPFELTDPPELELMGETRFSVAFQGLRSQVMVDMDQLREDNFRMHRPCVFLVTGSEPVDSPAEWEDAFSELVGSSFKDRPMVFPVGVDRANPETLYKIAFPKGRAEPFISTTEVDWVDYFRSILDQMLCSVLATSESTLILRGGKQTYESSPPDSHSVVPDSRMKAIAKELDVSVSELVHWLERRQTHQNEPSENPSDASLEIDRLRVELEEANEEIKFLKQSVAYFARQVDIQSE